MNECTECGLDLGDGFALMRIKVTAYKVLAALGTSLPLLSCAVSQRNRGCVSRRRGRLLLISVDVPEIGDGDGLRGLRFIGWFDNGAINALPLFLGFFNCLHSL